MTSVAAVESNVHVWGVDGSSDDLDVPLAELFKDAEFRTKHKLGSLNSINVARVVCRSGRIGGIAGQTLTLCH